MLITPNGRMFQYGPNDIHIRADWVNDLNNGKMLVIHITPGDRYGSVGITIDRPKPSEKSGFEYVDEDDLV